MSLWWAWRAGLVNNCTKTWLLQEHPKQEFGTSLTPSKAMVKCSFMSPMATLDEHCWLGTGPSENRKCCPLEHPRPLWGRPPELEKCWVLDNGPHGYVEGTWRNYSLTKCGKHTKTSHNHIYIFAVCVKKCMWLDQNGLSTNPRSSHHID